MTKSITTFYGTSVGKKVVMALSGIIVFGFVVVHILGNLQLFAGPQALNEYAAFLQGLGGIKWIIRGVLALATVIHMVAATQVTLQSWNARPTGYAMQQYNETTYAARTMRWGGPIIGLFIVYHLLHFTTGHAHPVSEGFTVGEGQLMNVYNNVVYGFQVWWASAIYIVTMIFVGLHLYHGIWSMLQTLGINHSKWNKWRRLVAVAFALFVAVGGVSLPVAVMAGIIQPV